MKTLRRSAAVLVALLLGAPAFACPLCVAQSSPRVRSAFFNTTIVLSLLPLGMLGAGVMWLRRSRTWEGQFEDRDSD